MAINKKNIYGDIQISDNAIAILAGTAVLECYGVVGVTSKRIRDYAYEILKKENYAKGVIINNNDSVINIDLYVILSYGIKISEVVNEIQKKVKYVVEKTLNIDVVGVNVHVEGIKAN